MAGTTEHKPLQLGHKVRSGLAALRAKARASLTSRGLSSLILFSVVLALISFGLDRPLRLAWGTRAVLLVVGLTVLSTLAWRRLLRPLSTDLPDDELARMVEATHPTLDWRLLSAVQFCDPSWRPGPETSGPLAELVVADADRLARDVRFGIAVPSAPMLQAAFRGLVVLAAAIALVTQFPAGSSTWFQRNVLLSKTARWPQDTYLKLVSVNGKPYVEGELIKVPRGTNLVLEVGLEPSSVVVPKRVYLDADGLDAGDDLILDDLGNERWQITIERVAEDFRFELSGNDSDLGPYEVKVIRPPWIEAIELVVTPPPYTSLPGKTLSLAGSDLSLPVGATVEVRARLSKPLSSAWVIERDPNIPEDPKDPMVGATKHDATIQDASGVEGGQRRAFTATFTLDQTAAFEVHVDDDDRADLEAPVRFTIQATPDGAPQVRLELLNVGLNVTPQATIQFKVGAEDDYGLATGSLRGRATGRPMPDPKDKDAPKQPRDPKEQRYDLPPLAKVKQGETEASLELGPMKLLPKMALVLWGAATDANPRGAQTGVSPSVHLRVVTPEELLNELRRRLNELGQKLEKMRDQEQALSQALEQTAAPPKERTATLERAPNVQKDIGEAVHRGSQTVYKVVQEMTANKVLDGPTVGKLKALVGDALRDLHAGELQTALRLATAARNATGDDQDRLSKEAAASATVVQRELDAIIEQLGKIEEIAELIAQLKRIIRKQRELMDKTNKKAPN